MSTTTGDYWSHSNVNSYQKIRISEKIPEYERQKYDLTEAYYQSNNIISTIYLGGKNKQTKINKQTNKKPPKNQKDPNPPQK